MAKGKGPGKNDDTYERTRAKLRAAAVELFLEVPREDPFNHVSLAEVARRAGVSRNGLHYHWRNREEFIEDMRQHLTGSEELFAEDFAKIRKEIERTTYLEAVEALERVATVDLQALAENTGWLAVHQLSLFETQNPAFVNQSRAAFDVVDHLTWDQAYGLLAARAGRKPRPPFTEKTVGAVLQTFIVGAGIRQYFDDTLANPESLDGSDRRFHGYALSVTALMAVLTTPIDGSDARSVEEVAGALLEGSS